MEYKTGDIIFFRTKFKWYNPTTWISALVRLFATIEYNHVGIVVLNWDMPMVNEAVGRGVISTPLNDRIKGKKVLVCRPVRDIKEKQYAVEGNSFLGKTPYDVIGLVFHQLVWTTSGYRIWIGTKDKAKAKEKFYCYEYVAYMNRNEVEDWWKPIPKEILNADWHKELIKIE